MLYKDVVNEDVSIIMVVMCFRSVVGAVEIGVTIEEIGVLEVTDGA